MHVLFLSLQVEILSTGVVHGPGEFVANLVFQGTYHEDVANFTGIVKTCENRAHLNDSECLRVKFGFEEFDWAQDGVINFTGGPTYVTKLFASKNCHSAYVIGTFSFGITNPLERWEYTVYEDGVETCVNIWVPPFMTSDLVEAYLSLILTTLSIVCLLITLITYFIFDELRNLPGLNLTALAFTTMAYQVNAQIQTSKCLNHRLCNSSTRPFTILELQNPSHHALEHIKFVDPWILRL